MNSKRILALLLAVLMVFLVACGGPTNTGKETQGEQPGGTESETQETGEAIEEREITVAGDNSLASMDYLTTSRNPDHTWNANFVETLVEYNNIGKLVGSLAESWEVSEDGLEWTFKLRPGVKWVTYTQEEYDEVKAEDFVTGLRHAAEFNSNTASLVTGVIKGFEEYMSSDFSDEAWANVGIEAVDELTVKYTLLNPTPYFGDIASYSVLMPVNREFLESKGAGCQIGSPESTNCTFGSLNPDSILYNGAFTLQSIDEKSQIVMIKNQKFYDANNVQISKYTEVYDDGSDPYSIKKGFENGTYTQMALRPTWSDYEQIKEQYKDNLRTSLPNATVFGLLFNYNRQVFDNTEYAQDETLRQNTRKAMLNENFRKALRASWDVQKYLEVGAPTDVAKATLRNINNFPGAGHDSTGRDYHQIVNDVYNKHTGENVNLQDGEQPFLSKEKALEYIEKAKAEGIEFPVHLDVLVIETSDVATKRAASMKQSISDNTDGQIIVELVLRPEDTVRAIAFGNEDASQSDFDISTFAGWGPDFNDPLSFAETFSPNIGTYMTSLGLGRLDGAGNPENPELKEQLGFNEYEKLLNEARNIFDDHDKRLEKFAELDSLLLEKALFVPTMMQTRFQLVTKQIPFNMAYSEVGLSSNKYKNLRIGDEILTTEEYEKLKAEWEQKVQDLAKEQAN